MSPSFVFTLPGLHSSGPGHWQTRWEELYGFTRIHQQDWDTPDKDDWVHTLHEILAPFPSEKIILIAHSLACSAVAYWAGRYQRVIRGALLVAPADVDRPELILGTIGFAPMPLQPLPFPSIVAASSNDPYASLERTKHFAGSWHSRFVNLGPRGHINSDSHLGDWPEGYELLQTL